MSIWVAFGSEFEYHWIDSYIDSIQDSGGQKRVSHANLIVLTLNYIE